MLTRFSVLGAVALLLLSGCAERAAEADAAPPPVQVVVPPAASAGGACILWDYGLIKQTIGLRFNVAAADQVDDTSTCVVQTVDAAWPTLTLSVVESTRVDGPTFLRVQMPEKAVKLAGLGKAAYRLNSPATADHGPTVEISWLSAAAQLQTLKFVWARGAKSPTAATMNNNLYRLAKALDTTAG